MKKSYIVTGAAGLIGSNIAKRLVEARHNVFALDDLSTGFIRNVPKGATFCEVDISDNDKLKSLPLPEQIEAVYHIAAQPSGELSFHDPARDMDVNFKGTYYLLELATALRARKFIYASSMSAYGHGTDTDYTFKEDRLCYPSSFYGCHKLASEKIIRLMAERNNFPYTCYRIFSAYGPGQNMNNMTQGMVSIYMSYLMKDQPIHVKGALDRFRDFIYIDDVVDVFVNNEDNARAHGEVFNLGTGRKTTIKELLTKIVKVFGKKNFEEWAYTEGSTPGDIKGCIADTQKIKARLDWEAKVSLDDGLIRMKKWLDETKDWWKAADTTQKSMAK